MYRLFRPGVSGSVKPRIVVAASGRGSNFEKIAEAVSTGLLNATLECLLVDRECGALEIARNFGIRSYLLSKPWHKSFDEIIDQINPHLIVLAGFMRIIPENLVEKYFPRIVNIHPSLLPAFPGKDAIVQAYEYGVKVTGVTVHIVDKGVDTGPIIFQKALEVDESWSLEQLEEKIHQIEHEWYWRVIRELLYRPFEIVGRKFRWLDEEGL
ncbi:phosphoribosylglycinamide formyltransferase [Fervidobacterium thailandense]|uniref:Phosphoribosylglycinamide formyltransferase n=1 Tax=Fervidobacterium thailandense TaxID=1008305 RepID=A0A1E3G1X8_9BACT|nr:phosphoribosylglycinamide formyltransferase [Fervidobacterium thailandense]ODN30274.1 phosphoribosylglycinamide formyltransferase [Fervidobacterium thailandense]